MMIVCQSCLKQLDTGGVRFLHTRNFKIEVQNEY